MNAIEQLLRDMEAAYSNPAPTGDGGTSEADFLDLLERAMPVLERVPHLLQCEEACKEWGEKTDWLTPTIQSYELGMHRADVLRKRCDDAEAHLKAQASEIARLYREQRDQDVIQDHFRNVLKDIRDSSDDLTACEWAADVLADNKKPTV